MLALEYVTLTVDPNLPVTAEAPPDRSGYKKDLTVLDAPLNLGFVVYVWMFSVMLPSLPYLG